MPHAQQSRYLTSNIKGQATHHAAPEILEIFMNPNCSLDMKTMHVILAVHVLTTNNVSYILRENL